MTHERPRATPEQLSKAYRNLADRHAEERSKLSAGRSWTRLQGKLADRAKQNRGLRLLRRSPRLSSFLSAPVALAAAATFLAASAWLVWSMREPELNYEVRVAGSVPRLEQRGGHVRTEARSAEIHFSDTSRLSLGAHSELRLDATGEQRVTADLVSGALSVDIHPTSGADWELRAGQYRIDADGTRFDLRLDQSGFAIFLHRGNARVSSDAGPSWLLPAGEHLRLPRTSTDESIAREADLERELKVETRT